MKITKTHLRQIIKEELSMALGEAYRDDVVYNPYTGPEMPEKERIFTALNNDRRRALNTEDPETAMAKENEALELIKQGKYDKMKKELGYPSYEKYNRLISALKKGEIEPEDLGGIEELTDEDAEDAKAGMERKDKERRMARAARKDRLRST